MLLMRDADLRGRRVLIREDLNVPQSGGRIRSDARIRAAIPTVQEALAGGAHSVTLMSHLGRPAGGDGDGDFSLAPVARALGDMLGRPVRLIKTWRGGDGAEHGSAVRSSNAGKGEVALLENLRFHPGEAVNDAGFAADLAALCDVFVMDAFATAHRAHASTVGVARAATVACAGPLLAAELRALGDAMRAPKPPLAAIIGGAKVSTKLGVLNALAGRAEVLIPGGGIANTFLAATGAAIGKSLAEDSMLGAARAVIARMSTRAAAIILPTDVVTAPAVDAAAGVAVRDIADVDADSVIVDVGPDTRARIASTIGGAGTVVWSGPMGVCENPAAAEGTRTVVDTVAKASATSIAGGGDTIAALEKFGGAAGFSYISTGGGAFLAFLAGQTLPAVAALEERAAGAG